jgi:UDP-N-acetylglucosamine diphosphorylase/glucosamine-1-phosphate N-acetyltransferase
MNNLSKLHVLILAGGLGKRMKSDIPKVLHKLMGKPMLVRVIETAFSLSPEKIFLIVGKYEPIIRETLAQYISLDNIVFVNQNEALGTGHAVQCALPELLQLPKDDKILILSGDVPLLKEDTMKSMFSSNCNVNLLTTLYEDPHGYGRIITNDQGHFSKITEEKDCNDEERKVKEVNAGVYAFQVELLRQNLPKISNNNAQQEYYLTDIFEIILQHEKLKIGLIQLPKERSLELIGVNTKEQLEELENKLK